MRSRVSLILGLVMTGVLLAGCGSDDGGGTTTPPPRVPVVEQVTQNDNFEGNPVFSPDGSWILFEADDLQFRPFGQFVSKAPFPAVQDRRARAWRVFPV